MRYKLITLYFNTGEIFHFNNWTFKAVWHRIKRINYSRKDVDKIEAVGRMESYYG